LFQVGRRETEQGAGWHEGKAYAAGVGVAILPQSVVLAQPHHVVTKPLPSSTGISEIAVAISDGR
jgi:hypothetical protein